MNMTSDISSDQNESLQQSPKTLTTVLLWTLGITICAVIATVFYLTTGTGGYFVIVLLYALLFTASYSDAAFRRIPNSFNYTALILALLLMVVICPLCEILGCTNVLGWIGANSSDWGGIALESLLGFSLCFLIGIISFAVNGLGGGDAKLLLVLGALAGFHLTLAILVNTLAFALAIGLLNLLSNGILIRTLQRLLLKIYTTVFRHEITEPIIFSRNESPFSLAVFLGLIALPFINIHAYIMNFNW